MFKEITKCRICGNKKLVSILNIREQCLGGIFPKSKDQKVPRAPLELVKCEEDTKENYCGLLQLKHTYELSEMYGDNYGYRSGLNQSMVKHLQNKVKKIMNIASLQSGDLIIDIGSNDCTLLKAYPKKNYALLGIDPTGKKFKKYYPDYVHLIPDFFSANLLKAKLNDKKAKVITSIAMFYDLENPLKFMYDIHEILDDEGIWVFEQSYMPTMLEKTSYDTVCHEHLEYYRLKQIKWMADKAGFKILGIELNDINGGSFSVTVAKSSSSYEENTKLIDEFLTKEQEKGLDTLQPYNLFAEKVQEHKNNLRDLIYKIKNQNKKIIGYGASTKGNVILQFCSITADDIPYIAEVNCDKYDCYTPGTKIPIISEDKAREMNPDYFFILPWHFKNFIVEKEKDFIESGGKLIFPLPSPHIVEK